MDFLRHNLLCWYTVPVFPVPTLTGTGTREPVPTLRFRFGSGKGRFLIFAGKIWFFLEKAHEHHLTKQSVKWLQCVAMRHWMVKIGTLSNTFYSLYCCHIMLGHCILNVLWWYTPSNNMSKGKACVDLCLFAYVLIYWYRNRYRYRGSGVFQYRGTGSDETRYP